MSKQPHNCHQNEMWVNPDGSAEMDDVTLFKWSPAHFKPVRNTQQKTQMQKFLMGNDQKCLGKLSLGPMCKITMHILLNSGNKWQLQVIQYCFPCITKNLLSQLL